MGLNDIVKIGDRLKSIRLSKGITQKEMAKELGLAYSTYSNYENNNRTPDTDTINRISEFLNVSIYDLTGIVPASAVKESSEESEYFFNSIEPLLKKLGYRNITFISNAGSEGNLVQLTLQDDTELKFPVHGMINLFKSMQSNLESMLVSYIHQYIDYESEISKITKSD